MRNELLDSSDNESLFSFLRARFIFFCRINDYTGRKPRGVFEDEHML